MNINRNNYEEFFLLYVDDELTAAEKKDVENFVHENKDLQQEFNLLLNTKLPFAEDIIFEKSTLYKTTNDFITTNNFEEKFLLYVDDELNAEEKQSVEKFVLQHPSTQQNFTTLKNTLLPKEVIVCPQKNLLYKKVEKPVIVLWLNRMAVAAAVLLFVFLAWQLLPTTTKKQQEVVKNNTINKKQNTVITTMPNQKFVTNNTVQRQAVSNKSTIANTTTNSKNNYSIIPLNNNNQPTINTQQNISIANNATTSTQNNSETIFKNNNTSNSNTVENVIVQNTITNVIPENVIAQNTTTTVTNSTPVAYSTLDTNNDELLAEQQPTTENEDVYIGNIQVKKSKVSSLLKKAKEFFGK